MCKKIFKCAKETESKDVHHGPAKQPRHTETVDDGVKLIHDTTIHDLAFFKRQQITVTNYAVGLYVALYASFRIVDETGGPLFSNMMGVLVICLAITLLGLSSFFLWDLHCSIKHRRDRLREIRDYLPMIYRVLRLANKKPSETPITYLLQSVILAGGILLVLIVVVGIGN
ncbi:MAG: hypothetical protein COA73_18725 [Candidatus Hydrogenedentota bacterium]|nr:MAG: hypothetical protein COA73_18725 [Candidatus Hydrogenedentota bacterium]